MEQTPETQASQTSGSATGQREKVSLSSGRGGILGVKAGMTQVYSANGESLAVTVINLEPTIITQVKTKENDGYQAVQVGFLDKKSKRTTKPEQGHAKKVGKVGFYHYQEFRLEDGAKMEGLTAGNVLGVEFLKIGDFVDLTAISKGKGFQGVMKRYHYAGGFKTHGASVVHRSLGSIGNRADPGRVFPGKKMAGQMGHVRRTVQNVRVVGIDLENNLLLVHGSVPGPRSGIVTVRRSVKKGA